MRLRFERQGWKLGLRTRTLGFGPQGWNMSFERVWTEKEEEKEKEREDEEEEEGE